MIRSKGITTQKSSQNHGRQSTLQQCVTYMEIELKKALMKTGLQQAEIEQESKISAKIQEKC